MDMALKDRFMTLWNKFFDGAELPICFYYTDDKRSAELANPASTPRCLIEALAEVRKGHPLRLGVESIGCPGGRRYTGFVQEMRGDFEYFLSCGIPGKATGERYKKSPELARESMKYWPAFTAPSRFIVFKRWDWLEESDYPEVAIFFAAPDVLSGLFTLANFDEAEPEGVIAPFGSGCSTIVQYPYLESNSVHPRAVMGMFDVSARPFVPADTLTFSVPISKLAGMADNMEESFLITEPWAKVSKRIGKLYEKQYMA